MRGEFSWTFGWIFFAGPAQRLTMLRLTSFRTFPFKCGAQRKMYSTAAPGRLTGKKILITGAGQGIGRASTLMFSKEGARVVAVDMNPKSLVDLKSQSVETRVVDITSKEQVELLAKEVGAIDALLNCAGYVANGTILESTEEDFDFSFDLNVKAMFRLSKVFLPGMLEKGEGSIINIASVSSTIKGVPSRCIYGASKAAVLGLTKHIAADFVSKGIRCNAICPGTIETESLQQRINSFSDPKAAREAFIARQPMGRLGKPEEIAALACYLASDESRFTTGEAFKIDGGFAL